MGSGAQSSGARAAIDRRSLHFFPTAFPRVLLARLLRAVLVGRLRHPLRPNLQLHLGSRSAEGGGIL
eukprot:2382212-Alexandrium_andersonii.AAC.1